MDNPDPQQRENMIDNPVTATLPTVLDGYVWLCLVTLPSAYALGNVTRQIGAYQAST
jgi:hypothetical protein